MNQRGQIAIGLAVTIGVLCLALAASVKWGFSQSEKRATAESSMRQWQATAMECSDSVEKAQKASLEAQQRAKAALSKAQATSLASQTAVARLKAQVGKQATCAVAVQHVRSSLTGEGIK